MSPTPSQPLESYAAIDLGSNSFHMVVAKANSNHVEMIDSIKESVRLGSGLDANKNITAETERRALDCLARFAQRLRDIPPSHVRIVGTNTLRRAKNATSFNLIAASILGKPIEIISGREEARLIYNGVSHAMPGSNKRRLVVDIGGGSTECIIGEGYTPTLVESITAGCVSSTISDFPDGVITPAGMKHAITRASVELHPLISRYKAEGWDEAIGCSGTIKAVGKAVHELELCHETITWDAMLALHDQLVMSGSVSALNLESISEDRLAVLAGGFAVLYAVMRSLDIKEMKISQSALREGVIFDIVGREEHNDVQAHTIQRVMTRYHCDAIHADRVQQSAVALYTSVATQWQLTEEHRNLLEHACALHEIGYAVSHSQYHKHGHYLLQNADLLGFSISEQNLLALMVRNHRRKFETSSYSTLPEMHRESTIRLTLLLRLAVLFHRDRATTQLPNLELKAHDHRIQLILPNRWLIDHPLTRTELEDEQNHLLQMGYELTVKDA